MEQNYELYHHGVKGMRWGVRRYQNKDGTLTKAGQKRYDRDVRENNAKKKDNRIVIDGPDPDRWVKEDLRRAKDVTDTTKGMTKELDNINNSLPKAKKQRMDLSKMTDQEMRNKINRELLERQYNDMFAPQKVSRGRQAVTTTLAAAGTALALTSSALSIALAIKELKG